MSYQEDIYISTNLQRKRVRNSKMFAHNSDRASRGEDVAHGTRWLERGGHQECHSVQRKVEPPHRRCTDANQITARGLAHLDEI
jgi:hypothetical protein